MRKFYCLIFISLFFISCSKILFYGKGTDEKWKKEEGVEFYYSKPYFLVTTSITDEGSTTTAQIIQLPDLANPKLAKFRSGFGSSNLSIALENGVLTSIGQEADSKIPETITSLDGLLGGGAESYTKDPTSSFKLYELKIDEDNNTLTLVPVDIN